MSHRLLIVMSGLFTLAFYAPIAVSAAPAPELRFGSVAMDVPVAMHRRLIPLTRYLSETLNMPVSLKLAKNMSGAINDISAGTVELAYLTPVAYIKSHEIGNTQIVTKTVTKGRASFKLMIVVKEDSPIKSLADLSGKSFAFGDKAALLQRAVVVGSGTKLESLGTYKYLGHYDNIVRAVLHGEFEAGILKDTMAYKWQGKGIRILYSSDELPPYNIAASSKVDEKLLAKIRAAFLKLDPKNEKHQKIIKALDEKYDGFAQANDKEYDVVRKLIAPFNKKK